MNNRVIKFRVWWPNEDNKGGQMQYNPDVYRSGDKLNTVFKTGSWEFMQFTGLIDKKGNEIYEGDICKQSLGLGFKPLVAVMVWNQSRAQFGLDAVVDYDIGSHIELNTLPEVIGNVFENPELLQ